MKKLITQTGGHPDRNEDILHIQNAYTEALNGIVGSLNDSQNTILVGCVVSGANNSITAGYIYFNGEVFFVPTNVGGVGALGVGEALYFEVDSTTTENPATLATGYTVVYGDTLSKGVHFKRQANLVRASSSLGMPFASASYPRVIPYGGIIAWSGAVATYFDGTGKGINGLQGWALCNGVNGTPNLRGQFIVGLDERTISGAGGADTDFDALGDNGGEKTHTLTKGELPKHAHGLATDIKLDASFDGTGTHRTHMALNDPGNSGTATGGYFGPANYHPSEDGSVDGLNGDAHNNLPPFYTLAYIKRIA